jgi:hypothetical protein
MDLDKGKFCTDPKEWLDAKAHVACIGLGVVVFN